MGHSRLPALSELGGSGFAGVLEDAFSPARLAEMGMAGAGGAANALFNRFILARVMALPGVNRLPSWLTLAGSGFVLGNVAWTQSADLAKGVVGHAAGTVADLLVARLGLGLGRGVASMRSFGPARAQNQLAPLNPQVRVGAQSLSGGLSEVIPAGGIGSFGATVQPIVRQPSMSPQFRAVIGAN